MRGSVIKPRQSRPLYIFCGTEGACTEILRTARADWHDMLDAGGKKCRVLRDLQTASENHSETSLIRKSLLGAVFPRFWYICFWYFLVCWHIEVSQSNSKRLNSDLYTYIGGVGRESLWSTRFPLPSGVLLCYSRRWWQDQGLSLHQALTLHRNDE